MKALKRCVLFGIACMTIGYALRIAIVVLLTRVGWQVGGEILVLLGFPACIWVGMHLGARLKNLPITKDKKKTRIPYAGIS